jgi:drug/metabolite transporter (DMT)-like permease
MGLAEWGLLLFLSVLWGGSFFFSKVALTELPPFTVVFARVTLAAATLALYLVLTGRGLPRGRVWLSFLGMGLLNNIIPFSLIFWGQTAIASGLASILNATTPIFTILVAQFLTTDERLTAGKFAGVVLGLAGVAVLMGGGVVATDTPALLGMAACLGAALSYGFAGAFGRRFRRLGVPPASVAFGQTAASTLMMAPIAALADAPWTLPMPSAVTIGALLGLAVLSTALAYIVFFRILSSGGATNASLVTLLIPVSAILLGSLVLGERLAANHFAGMALIALGLVAIDGRLARRFHSAPEIRT